MRQISQVIYYNGTELTVDTNYKILIGGGDSESDRVRFITANSENTICSLAVFNSSLYAGTSPNGNLYEFNSASSAWTQVAPKLGSETCIYPLAVYNSQLYGGTAPNGKLYEWNDSSAWVEGAPKLGSETYIYSLIVYNSQLYGGTSPNGKLYQWNDSSAWVEVAPKLGAETHIYQLAVSDPNFGATSTHALLSFHS